MRVRVRRSLVLALLVAALTAIVSAQAFDLRLGQWEYTMSGIKLPPEMLAKLPPAARAQAELMMKKPAMTRSCLTAADLKELNLARPDDEDCKVTSKKITGTTADVIMACKVDGATRTQTLHYEALSRESVRGVIKASGGNGPSEVTITGKWIEATCKED